MPQSETQSQSSSEKMEQTAIDGLSIVNFIYRNHAGNVEVRTVNPIALSFGDTGRFHNHKFAWYLKAFCCDRGSERMFLLTDITAFGVIDVKECDAALVQELITRLVPNE